jgi:hypothetical protein
MKYFVCPKRNRQFEIRDFWNVTGNCSYCGIQSMSAPRFIDNMKEGKTFEMDKMNHICIMDGEIFRLDHATQEQKNEIRELYFQMKGNR